ncbi:hypothetical protein Q0V21_08285 [Paenibacillus sp. 11B]|uniref:hypothetical protein n=1 Tax=Paenibacillus sp. 11B TaxID=3060965 RepID=UPI00264FEB48|nr:hypothetical protein [Paenibacillus sp. 11B]MDN8588767.1 hypothetical protein [Paenibacillus sp. 11B]
MKTAVPFARLSRETKVQELAESIQTKGLYPVLNNFHVYISERGTLKNKVDVWTYVLGLVCDAIRGLPQVEGTNIKVAPMYDSSSEIASIMAWPSDSEATHTWYSKPVRIEGFEVISAQYDWEGESLGI